MEGSASRHGLEVSQAIILTDIFGPSNLLLHKNISLVGWLFDFYKHKSDFEVVLEFCLTIWAALKCTVLNFAKPSSCEKVTNQLHYSEFLQCALIN